MSKIIKENLRELLEDYYDERLVATELLHFYESKLDGALSSIWKKLHFNQIKKIKELDVDIQFVRERLVDKNNLDKLFDNPIELMNSIIDKTFNKEE